MTCARQSAPGDGYRGVPLLCSREFPTPRKQQSVKQAKLQQSVNPSLTPLAKHPVKSTTSQPVSHQTSVKLSLNTRQVNNQQTPNKTPHISSIFTTMRPFFPIHATISMWYPEKYGTTRTFYTYTDIVHSPLQPLRCSCYYNLKYAPRLDA